MIDVSGNAALECADLVKRFDEGPRTITVLNGINFQLARGERVAIIGNSGSGKTTFLQLLGGLDTPTAGSVNVSGRDFSALSDGERGRVRNQEIGFVYQFHHLLPEFTALENVAMPLLIGRMPTKQAAAQAEAMLDRVGLSQRISHKPSQLSGGERQRVAIARAMVNKPACILADEPTGNLDVNTAQQIQELIVELNQSLQTSFLIVTHDLSIADRVDRVLRMEAGELHEQ